MDCPKPSKIEKSWETFETLFLYEDKFSIKKIFHHWPSEVQASVHGRYCPSRLDWQCKLAHSSEDQWWIFFLCLLFLHMGIKFKKKSIPNFCSILLRLGQTTSHMWKVICKLYVVKWDCKSYCEPFETNDKVIW